MSVNAIQLAPTSGIDMVKTLNQWYSESKTNDNGSPEEQRKAIKCFKNLIIVMGSLGNFHGASGPNSLATQFLIKVFDHTSECVKADYQADKVYMFMEGLSKTNEHYLIPLLIASYTYIN